MNYDYDGQETGRKKTEGMKVLIVEPLNLILKPFPEI